MQEDSDQRALNPSTVASLAVMVLATICSLAWMFISGANVGAVALFVVSSISTAGVVLLAWIGMRLARVERELVLGRAQTLPSALKAIISRRFRELEELAEGMRIRRFTVPARITSEEIGAVFDPLVRELTHGQVMQTATRPAFWSKHHMGGHPAYLQNNVQAVCEKEARIERVFLLEPARSTESLEDQYKKDEIVQEILEQHQRALEAVDKHGPDAASRFSVRVRFEFEGSRENFALINGPEPLLVLMAYDENDFDPSVSVFHEIQVTNEASKIQWARNYWSRNCLQGMDLRDVTIRAPRAACKVPCRVETKAGSFEAVVVDRNRVGGLGVSVRELPPVGPGQTVGIESEGVLTDYVIRAVVGHRLCLLKACGAQQETQ